MFGPRARISPSSAIRSSTPGIARADGADARRVGRVHGQDRRRFGQAVALDDRQADALEELGDVPGSGALPETR